jgi:predicted lipoprotein with Yx(FWY)xxD motif
VNRTGFARWAAGALIVGATAAACGTGGGGGTTGGNNMGAANQGQGTVSVSNRGGMDNVLVDRSGQTLYAAQQENNRVQCTSSCLSVWMPVIAAKNAKLTKEGDLARSLSTITRPDNRMRQVTFKGHPLYTFTSDSGSSVSGNNVTDQFNGISLTWHVVTESGPSMSGSAPSNGSGGGY